MSALEEIFVQALDMHDVLIATADVVADRPSRELLAVDQHNARAEPSRGFDRWLTEGRRRDEDALLGLPQAECTEEFTNCGVANVVALGVPLRGTPI